MNLEMIARTMQLIIAPVVMLNACALLVSGLLTHYATINARMRDLNRERIERLRDSRLQPSDVLLLERLSEIDVQTPELLARHRLLRDAILCVYGGITFLVISMLVIAAATAFESVAVYVGALVVFLLGTMSALIGLLLVGMEIRRSHRAIEFEVSRVGGLSAHTKQGES